MIDTAIGDIDFDAYIDDQLDPARRIAVEAHLAAHPQEAARVMADLRARDELRLALAARSTRTDPRTADAARKVERGLRGDRFMAGLRRAAAIAVFIGVGWLANEAVGPIGIGEVVASAPPPAYVEDARRAHVTSALRATMVSQPEVPDYDPVELRAATGIVMPELPDEWVVRDVQVFPSRFGPSVEMAIKTEAFGLVSLFAVRPGTFDVVEPTIAGGSDTSAAFFQIGEVAYALVASGDARKLDAAAERLADTLY